MSAKPGNSKISSVLWGIFLWIIVPVGLFVGGYNFVGPKIGEVPVLSKQATDLLASKTTQDPKPLPDDSKENVTDDSKGPEVEVTVEKSKGRSSRRDRGSDESKPKKKKKKSTTAKPTTPVHDAASADGALGGGDGPADPAGGSTGGEG